MRTRHAAVAAFLVLAATATAWAQQPSGSGQEPALQPQGLTVRRESSKSWALHWLGTHQNKNGSWSFANLGGPGEPTWANPGTWPSKQGATGLVVLCYLSAGQTHKIHGPYRENIAAGLKYLKTVVNHADSDDLVWYGVATTALCEAYGMTGDQDMGRYAQKALDSIARRQDADSGGWAAGPKKKPAMSTTAWQMAALKGGQMNGLDVDAKTLRRVLRFLEKVQSDGGATYGEEAPGKEPAATAMGLLCRQYNGTTRTDAAMQRGVAFLGGLGPSKTDLAFDYFATEALYNYYGYEWDVWNRATRKLLISSQIKEGAEAGSWWIPDEIHATGGGRLYQTALAALILDLGRGPLPLYRVRD